MLNLRHVISALFMAALAVQGRLNMPCYSRKMNCKQGCPSGAWHHYTTDHGCCKSFWSCFGNRKTCIICPGRKIIKRDGKLYAVRRLEDTVEEVSALLPEPQHTPEGEEHWKNLIETDFTFGDDDDTKAELEQLAAEGELATFDGESEIGRKVLDLVRSEEAAEAAKTAKNEITPPPTSSPTDSPTPSPTANPTQSPTSPPTDPTHSPTPSPTATPTTQPTSPPTDPTTSPTPSPTATPTTQPTSPPTDPTTSPTPSPTATPTAQPTPSPTLSPTLEGGDDNISIIDDFTDDVPAACKSVASDCLNDSSCLAMLDVTPDNHILPCGDSGLCVDFQHCVVMQAVDKYAMANGCPDEFKACVGDYECYGLLSTQEPGELPECGENEACATYKECHLEHLKKSNVKYEVAHYLHFEVTKPESEIQIAEKSMAKCEEYLPKLTDFIKKDVPGAKPLDVDSKCISDEESEFTLTFEERGENKMEERFAFTLALGLVEDGIWAEHQFEVNNPMSYSRLVERKVSEDDDGLSGGAVAGIVIGVLLAVGVIGGAIIYFK